LRLERRNKERRIQMRREIARGDADIPSASLPVREFVIRQGARRHGENRLAAKGSVQQFKYVRFPRASRGMDDDVLAVAQSVHRLLLPQVRQ
jgi:hypothetical protein